MAAAQCPTDPPPLPDCATDCIASAASAIGCKGPTDFVCQCQSATDFAPKATPCLISSCGGETALSISAVASSMCSATAVRPISISLPSKNLSSQGADTSSRSPRIQDKDQIQAEQQAKDPEKMAKMDKDSRSKPEDVRGGLHTPGVKGKSRDDESIGRSVKDKSSG
ncbi:hypothetical protein VTK73DRAFT_573 [Phialemonium thermophilum]|uniref:CFEM domain-containing protein n=1 Tax=Phialemonium thermophilum TaxID=223376 RepID=A0ABR3XEG5_9PEZI